MDDDSVWVYVDAEAAALGRKVAEALEAGGCGLLGETERLIIYRALQDPARTRRVRASDLAVPGRP